MTRYFMFGDNGGMDGYEGSFDTLEAAWAALSYEWEVASLAQLIDDDLVAVARSHEVICNESDTRRIIQYGWRFDETGVFVPMVSRVEVWKPSKEGEWVDENEASEE